MWNFSVGKGNTAPKGFVFLEGINITAQSINVLLLGHIVRYSAKHIPDNSRKNTLVKLTKNGNIICFVFLRQLFEKNAVIGQKM